MNPHDDDRVDQRMSSLLSAADRDVSPPDKAFLNRLRDESTQTFMAVSAQKPARSRRYRIMQSRILKWAVPAGIAAGVVLAVGLWPNNGGAGRNGSSGRVYAMADVMGLLRETKIIHVKGTHYVFPDDDETREPIPVPIEYWFRLRDGRSRCTSMGISHDSDGVRIRRGEVVFDGEYTMLVDHNQKTAIFLKHSPVRKEIERRSGLGQVYDKMFGKMKRLEGFAKVGESDIKGTKYDVWENEENNSGRHARDKIIVWLSPKSGELGRIQYWSARRNDPWMLDRELSTIERDVVLPLGVFGTRPPEGYEATNTKETAGVFGLGCGTADCAGLNVAGVTSFTLSDGTVIAGWRSWDRRIPPPEKEYFDGLQPGEALPSVPVEVCGLKPAGIQTEVTYIGRHLAVTFQGEDYTEWGIYVPDGPLPSTREIWGYSMVNRFNLEGRHNRCSGVNIELANVAIQGPADFGLLVRGAMAELSDDGKVPAHVTYENVMQLSRRLRAELAGNSADPER